MTITWDWEQVEAAVKELAKYFIEVKGDKDTLMVGIQRGGIIPGALLARTLGLKYDIISPIQPNDDYKYKCKNFKRVVFVDDINDEGLTINLISSKMSETFADKPEPMFNFATLVKRKGTKSVSYSAIDIEGDDWVCFPWEHDEKPERDNLL